MRLEEKLVEGAFCPVKHLLIIDGEPVIFGNTDYIIKLMTDYIQGSNIQHRLLNENTIRILKPYREMYLLELI